MSQAVEKPVKLFIDAIKLFLYWIYFSCLTLPIKQIENGKYFEKSLEKFFWMNFILSDVERLDFIYKARNIIISKQ